MATRQAKSIAKIRAERRKKKLCVECGNPSKTYRCHECRPPIFDTVSDARRAAVRVRILRAKERKRDKK